jgi:hypothetical protein
MGYPRHQRARDFKFIDRRAGNLTTTSTTYVDLSTPLDLTLTAQTGDTIEYGLNASVQNTGSGNVISIEVFSLVSAAVVNGFSGVTDGSWRTNNFNAATFLLVAGSVLYNVVSGDLSAGTITARLQWKTSAGTATLYGDGTNRRAHFYMKNLGPQDPN